MSKLNDGGGQLVAPWFAEETSAPADMEVFGRIWEWRKVVTVAARLKMYPNHYAGAASGATAARGAALVEYNSTRLAAALRAGKAERVSPRLQREFFEKTRHPLDTKQ